MFAADVHVIRIIFTGIDVAERKSKYRKKKKIEKILRLIALQ